MHGPPSPAAVATGTRGSHQPGPTSTDGRRWASAARRTPHPSTAATGRCHGRAEEHGERRRATGRCPRHRATHQPRCAVSAARRAPAKAWRDQPCRQRRRAMPSGSPMTHPSQPAAGTTTSGHDQGWVRCEAPARQGMLLARTQASPRTAWRQRGWLVWRRQPAWLCLSPVWQRRWSLQCWR